jgi:Mrp family chromosome partitioning ATPase
MFAPFINLSNKSLRPRFTRCSADYVRNNCQLFSTRVELEKQVQDALQSVIDPVSTSSRSIVSTGGIQGITVDSTLKKVTIDLELFVPGHPYASKIQHSCIEAIRNQLSWVQNVEVNVLKKRSSGNNGTSLLQGSSLVNVEHIIAISSCKGGVGKSTVAVNLACELQRRGLRVGLLDADIYGPSLPLMVQTTDLIVKKSTSNPKWIQPLVCANGLKVMSFGYVNPRSGAPGAGGKGPAVMRGPIATRVINQLVGATEWGELDYLLVDLPPGTGDIQITLGQAMSFSGAVIVTTPHEIK